MRLIDVSKWPEFYNELTKDIEPYDQYQDGYEDAISRADDWIDNQPTITPESLVVHGRWGKGSNTRQPCSVCGYRGNKHFNYCPNCGAKMDLEE